MASKKSISDKSRHDDEQSDYGNQLIFIHSVQEAIDNQAVNF